MNIPDTLPTLAGGSHDPSERKVCAMEAAAWLAGEEHSDSPKCVLPMIARVAINVNDNVDDATRQTMWPLIIRCLDTNTDDVMVVKRLALWCAEKVLPIYEARHPGDGRVRTCVEVTRRFLDGEATVDELIAARAAAAYANAYAAAYAAYAAAYAAYAANAANAAANAYAAAAAAHAYANAAEAKVQFLSDLLDEYDRLTGRTVAAPKDEAWERLMEFAR